MKAVPADFSPPSRPPLWAWALLLAVGAAACALLLNAWQTRRALVEAQRTHEAHQAAALADASRPEPPPAPPPVYDASARQFLGERSAAWPQALRVLENVQITGIQVQSFDVGSADRLVRVEVTAPGHAAAMEYLSALNEGVQGHSGDIQWVLTRSVVGEGQIVRAQLLGSPIPIGPPR